jgi:eukaryotic-like serine/threonine-protein kinase
MSDYNTAPIPPISYLTAGQKLGKYEIKQLIGRGGMAEVYLARNPDLNNDVAIKLLHPYVIGTEEIVRRFRQEAQAVAALNHPNIIRVFDFFASENTFYMVMEYIKGSSLRQLIADHPNGMPLDLALQIFVPLAEAVGYAHEHGVVHRDIKPDNVLLASKTRPILTDFGIARVASMARITSDQGHNFGTPSYMPPELVLGNEARPQSDIYSLGIMLYEMVTGDVPFRGESITTIVLKHLQDSPPPLKVGGNLDPNVERVIMQALRKYPDERFATVGEMLQALRGVPIVNAVRATETIQISDIFPTQDMTKDAPPRTPTVNLTSAVSNTMTVMKKNPVISMGFLITVALVLVGGLILYELRQLTTIPQSPPSTATSAPTVPAAPPGMVFIPGTTFTMGTTRSGSNEGPPHDVTLSSYYLDKTEVTNRDYLTFVIDQGIDPPKHWVKPKTANWVIEATGGFVMGSPTARFSYDGKTNAPIAGKIRFDVNAEDDTGDVTMELDGALTYKQGVTKTGRWKIVQKNYSSDQPFFQGGVATDVTMHGDSGQEAPFYPTMQGALATWGDADLYLDGELVESDLGIHTMYTKGVRTHQHEVVKGDKTCCYDPQNTTDGHIDETKEQLIVLLFTKGMYTAGAPGPNTVWLEVYFTDVKVSSRPDAAVVAFPAGTGSHPVTNVMWNNAAAYCEYVGKRLPTEAEWEYAARGSQGYQFPWGNNARINGSIPANWNGKSVEDVSSYPAGQSEHGLMDMAGNAWEWVNDWYQPDYYATSPKENPTGPSNGLLRVLRGGGYSQLDATGPAEYASTFRLPQAGDMENDSFGFRCAKDVS